MGITCADLRLGNYARPDLEELDASALVDTGALHLRIPEHVAMQLQLQPLKKREVQTADGKSHLIDYVAPIKISMLGRECVTGALVMGNQVLLGAIPLEDMDLIIEPAKMRVSVNPLSPNIPMSLAKNCNYSGQKNSPTRNQRPPLACRALRLPLCKRGLITSDLAVVF